MNTGFESRWALRTLHILAIAVSASGCASYDTYAEPQSNQPHAVLTFENTGGSPSTRPWPMQMNGARPAGIQKRVHRIHPGAMRLQVADHLEDRLPYGPPSFPVYRCDVAFDATAGKIYSVSMTRERDNRYLFVVTAGTNTEVAKCRSIVPDPIDRLMTRLDSSDEWKLGEFPRVDLPATATAEQLMAQLAAQGAFNGKGVETYEILSTLQRAIPYDSRDSYLIVLVDTRIGMKIVLFTFRTTESNWWNRVFDPIPPV